MTLPNYNTWCLSNGLNPNLFNYNISTPCCNSNSYNNGTVWGSIFGIAGLATATAIVAKKSNTKTNKKQAAQEASAETIKTQQTNVDNAKKAQEAAKKAYDEAVNAFDKAHTELNTKIKNAEGAVKKSQDAKDKFDGNKTTIQNYENQITELTNKKQTVEATDTEEVKTKKENNNKELDRQIEAIKAEKTKLENENNTLKAEADKLEENKKQLEQAKTDRENLLNCQENIKDLKTKLEEASQKVADEEKKLEDLKALQNMSSNIDKVDGCGLGRLVDGKDTVKDKLAAFRRASDKLTQHDISSLTQKDLKALRDAEELADTIDKGDNQSDNMKTVSDQLRAFANTHKDEVAMYTRIINNEATADDIKNSGYFKKQDRYVGDTKMTTYNGKGDNDSYVIIDGKAVHLTEVKSGNVLHKVHYGELPVEQKEEQQK